MASSNLSVHIHILPGLQGRVPNPLRIIGLAALYFVAAKIGLQFATVGQNVTLVWPPAGLAVAALILSHYKLWPGVALGAFLVHATTGFFLPEVCMVTVGNTLEAVAAAYLLQHFLHFHPGFDRTPDVLGFVIMAVLAAPVISAFFGTLSLLLNGDISLAASPLTGLTWWAGDAMGILIVAPPFLIWGTQREVHWTRSQIIEAGVLMLLAIVVSAFVFSVSTPGGNAYPLAHLTLPFLIWVALRFGQRGTSTIALLISAIAVWGTSQQAGPFARPSLDESELFLASFIVLETIISMLLAAILAQSKRVEVELMRERDFATQVMNQLGQGVAVTGEDGQYEFINAAYARMLGYTPEELIGKNPTEIVLPEDQPLRNKASQERQAGFDTHYELRLQRADGRPVHTLISGTPRRENGKVKGEIAVITDLTDQKQTELALRESQARLQSAIENFPFEFWATDLEGRYVLQSPVSIQRRGNLVGQRMTDLQFLPQAARERWEENNRRIMRGETLRGEVTYGEDREQRTYYYTISPIRDGEAVIGMLGVDIEITDLKRAELALKKNEETSHIFLERLKALQEISIDLSKTTSIDALSRSAVELGRSKLKFDRLGIWLVHDDMEFMSGTFGTDEKGAIRDERSQTLPFDLGIYPTEVFGDGKVRLYTNEHAPLYDDQHQIIGYGWSALASVQDGSRIVGTISTDNLIQRQPLEPYQIELLILYANTLGHLFARKEAEAALQQLTAELEQRVAERTAELEQANIRLTELDRLKTKFIADVSHELRTPLAVLNTRVYLLQHSQPEKYPEYLDALKIQLERLADFVNAILDLSRLELGAQKIAFGAVNLNDTVRQVVTTLLPRAEMAGLSLHSYLSTDLPPVRGELNQIAQVATNLIANAIKYTPNGSIQVRTCLDANPKRVVFEVEDTGIGIHPDDQAHLFERFYRGVSTGQSNIPGSGLGLSIVKEIIDLHNGDIEIESEVGKGTLFRVLLPIWQD